MNRSQPPILTLWVDPAYANTTSNATYTLSYSISNVGPNASKAERRLREQMGRMDETKLEKRLRQEEANRKAMSDAAARKKTVSGAATARTGRRLQTYDNAMAARMAARRLG